MIKIVFLDINGVLNTSIDYNLNQKCIDNLAYIIKQTGAKVVITSAWRRDEYALNSLVQTLNQNDIEVLGCTKILNQERSLEILAYISGIEEEHKYVILDDLKINHFPNTLVLVDRNTGLTYEDALKATKILQD